jgi:PAS domain S-box-containing protein
MRGLENPKINILCVDDQPGNLIALEAALGNLGYEIFQVQSGKEALLEVTRHDFAAILLDVQMPIIDGFETANLMREIERSKVTPIIFLTANYPSEEYVLRGYEVGAVDYLFKPLNIQVLRAKVAVFVELFKKNLELKKQSELLREIELREVRRIGERKYENLVEGIREGIVWAADPETFQFTFVSRHAEKITGYPLENWFQDSRFLENCIPVEDRERLMGIVKGTISDSSRTGIEHEFIKASGDRIWFQTDIHLEDTGRDGKKELRGLSVNVSHLKETEKALRDAIEVRDEFLSIAAHELKTPITPLQLQMQSFIRLIEQDKIGTTSLDKLKGMLEISSAQVSRLTRLISQLLDVSRLREGRLVLELEKVNLRELVQTVVEQLQHQFEMSDCKVILHLEDKIQASCDRLRIEQVLINLLTNSTKYAAGKPIEVYLAQDSRQITLSVKDNGIGVAPLDQKRIFERFERAVPARNFGGLVLGLYISREIVDLHKGTISVESETDRGAMFTVVLPKQ